MKPSPLHRLLLAALSATLWAALAVSSARAEPLEISSIAAEPVDLSSHWRLQPATSAEVLPSEAAFRPLADPAQLRTHQAYWFRVELENQSPINQNRLLEMDNPLLSRVRAILIRPGHSTLQFDAGLAVPGSAKPLAHPTPVIPFALEANSRATLYVYADSADTFHFSARLWAPQPFYDQQLKRTVVKAAAFGIMFVMALYNLLIWAITRDRVFASLSTMIGSLTLFLLIGEGWAATYLWPELPRLNASVRGPSAALAFMAMLNFSQLFLKIPERGRKASVLKLAFGFNVLMTVVLAVHNTPVTFNALLAANVLAVTVPLATAAGQIRRGRTEGAQFLLAAAPLLLMIPLVLGNRLFEFGIDSSLMRMLLLMSCALLAIGFAILLALRIRRVNLERDHAFQDLVLAEHQVKESVSKAEAAHRDNTAKSAFLATMSHEIRTPMNGILGMADLLEHTELDHQQSYYLATLTRSGRALMDILNDVLDYSKVEAGKLELEHIETNLLELLDDLIILFRDPLQKKGLDCYLFIHPDVPQFIQTDPTRLKQVLANLISNAIKFTQEGEISLTVEPGDRGTLWFSIADEGVGMDAETTATLFNRFQQADSSISRRYGGTGLGLAISRHLVELFGGSFEVESQPGCGSTFRFQIRYRDCARTAAPPDLGRLCLLSPDDQLAESVALIAQRWQKPFVRIQGWDDDDARLLESLAETDVLIADGPVENHVRAVILRVDGAELSKPFAIGELAHGIASLTSISTDEEATTTVPLAHLDVLVAEDNPTNRLVVGKLLSTWGANVRFAENGLEATRIYEASHRDVDLVLMDCEMPEMDGYGATRAIRQLENNAALSATPIIALTAHVLPEFRHRAQEVGMTDYVTKPVKREALLAAILSATGPDRTADRHSP